MNTNSDNPRIGKNFELLVKQWFEKEYKQHFELHKKIKIGNPPKDHCFDIANEMNTIVVECKCYTWTETGNVPSAKLAYINEAVLYLLHLPTNVEKFVVLPKINTEKRKESLAEYYYKRYYNLLHCVKIMEYDSVTIDMHIISKSCHCETD